VILPTEDVTEETPEQLTIILKKMESKLKQVILTPLEQLEKVELVTIMLVMLYSEIPDILNLDLKTLTQSLLLLKSLL
jgi:hypothetical protein